MATALVVGCAIAVALATGGPGAAADRAAPRGITKPIASRDPLAAAPAPRPSNDTRAPGDHPEGTAPRVGDADEERGQAPEESPEDWLEPENPDRPGVDRQLENQRRRRWQRGRRLQVRRRARPQREVVMERLDQPIRVALPHARVGESSSGGIRKRPLSQ